jgi:tetratricopeptide (TPR) repeat protein
MLDPRRAKNMKKDKRANAGTLAGKRETDAARNSNASARARSEIRKDSRMAASKNHRTIDTLLQQEAWDEARQHIEKALAASPDNHWLLTQLGVTYYEQRQHREALRHFLNALEIVPDCPLTLWNLAGALDALDKPERAIPIYTWLLRSKKSPDDDPCWESAEWRDALKTDCVYRLGVCFQHLEQWESAEHCFRQYINLLLTRMQGTYTFDDAARHIREIHTKRHQKVDREVQDVINSTLQDPGLRSIQGGRRRPPKLSLSEVEG